MLESAFTKYTVPVWYFYIGNKNHCVYIPPLTHIISYPASCCDHLCSASLLNKVKGVGGKIHEQENEGRQK